MKRQMVIIFAYSTGRSRRPLQYTAWGKAIGAFSVLITDDIHRHSGRADACGHGDEGCAAGAERRHPQFKRLSSHRASIQDSRT